MQPITSPQQQGFTVIELLVVMGIIAILASIVLIALNPAKHFAQARNTQRTSNVETILNAISQNIAENKGVFTCTDVNPNIPTNPTVMGTATTEMYHIAQCLVPTQLPALPFDPTAPGANYTSSVQYNTGYQVVRDSNTGRITVSAPAAELGSTISITR